jgi:DNA-binding CsgD family transcriptional regulator/tetratricopeptide (TPR) repeat protein
MRIPWKSHLEALAYHAFEAGLWSKTAVYAQRAGEKALALYAPQAAVDQFSRAIEAMERLSQAPNRILYQLRGRAYDTLGKFAEAREDFEAALKAAEETGDQETIWQISLDLALLWGARDYARAGDYCRRALDLARAMGKEAAIAHSLNRLGNWLMNSGQPYKALNHHREALAQFEELQDRAGIAETLDLLAMTSNQSGDAGATVTYYKRAIRILRELQDQQTLSSSLANLALYTLRQEDAHEAVKLAREIGWQPGEAYALNCLAAVLFHRSRYGESLALRNQSLALAEAIEHPQWMASNHVYFGYSYKELLALDRAEEHLVKGYTLAKQIGSSFFTWMGGGVLASVYILQNRLEEAEALLANLPLGWIPALLSVRLARIELAIARQNPDQILQLIDEKPEIPTSTDAAFGMLPFFQGPALRRKAQALQWLDRDDEAEQTLLQTIQQYANHSLTHGLWQIYLTLGQLYFANSRPEQAREMFSLAREHIDTLAATIDEATLREGFARRAAALIPEIQSLTPRQSMKRDFGGLTQRERQVAAVIAQGLSNQEIAESLVVSIKTVEAHITRILSKLGFHSRAQIAAWAVEKGLASAPQDLDTLSRGS